ncbi:hypothetical protein CK203_040191 [Vitis vinifera]|uniref:Pentatricopeptide repeat-containing protein n=1 Tax=Vitis vinifera TaxID=29760 RepID=A0A438H3H6_VITVI|nr:hypothetical protein CK203_040191 [Vitis vinifera]
MLKGDWRALNAGGALEVFADMEELGVKPDEDTVRRVACAFQTLGQEDKQNWFSKNINANGSTFTLTANGIEGTASELCTWASLLDLRNRGGHPWRFHGCCYRGKPVSKRRIEEQNSHSRYLQSHIALEVSSLTSNIISNLRKPGAGLTKDPGTVSSFHVPALAIPSNLQSF